MSQQQRDVLDQLLRDGPLDLGGDVPSLYAPKGLPV
jgi:hypothetical protein